MAYARINGVRLYYELHGDPHRPLLVLNNGILMNAAASWINQTEALARHYHVLQYDCRGQGLSDHPAAPYSMAQHAQDLAGLLEALDQRAAHIAGISYGGEVAQAFALAYPDRTRSLFLADTVSEVGPELRLAIESWIEPARRADAEAFFHASVPWNFSAAFITANQPLLERSRQRYHDLDFPAVVRLCEAFLGVDFTARLPEIHVPTCILVGELDILKGLPYARILQNGLPQAEFHLLPGSGHASCWEKPAAFNTILLGFLAKLPG